MKTVGWLSDASLFIACECFGNRVDYQLSFSGVAIFLNDPYSIRKRLIGFGTQVNGVLYS